MKRNIFIVIISVLILTCIFAFARTTTTNLGLVLPTWEENVDRLDDLNSNFGLIDDAFDDPLAYGDDTIVVEDFADDDWGEASISSNVFSIDDDVLLSANFANEDWGDMTVSTNTVTLDAEVVDSAQYIDGSIDHEHLSADTIHGLTADTLAAADEFIFYDVTGTALDKITWTNLMGSITKVGTIATGVWQGTAIADGYIPNNITIDLATLATTLTVTDNESTNETNAILFTSGGDLDGGDLDIESDGDLYYNPSTGALTAKMHRVYLADESTALNAAWYQITSSVVTGDLTGLRSRMLTDAVSGGDATTGVNVRGVYGQAVAEASAHAGLLQGGLFVADLSAGGATVYNVHVLCGHYSSGANTTIGGDLYVGYLRSQTRSTNFRSVGGYDVILALENEAIEGDGEKIDSAIRIFDTNVAGDGFNYGIDISGASITTADVLLQNSGTIDNSTANRITIGGGDLNIDNNRKYLINGTQITSDALSDVASIAMLDEAEAIAGNWVNTTNPWADNEITNDPTITIADTTDSTCFPLLAETVTGAQKVKSDAGLTYDASTGDLKATLHGGITEANLLDKSATETVSGTWTFSGGVVKIGSAAFTMRRVDDTPGNDAHMHFQRKRSTGAGDVSDDDELGHIGFWGWDTQYNEGARIQVVVDGTPGDGDMPTRIEFLTSADASATPTLAMTISSAQVVTFANDLADSEISDTLTASDLVAGGSVVEDSEVDDDITIDLATLATTITVTDNENEDLDCPILFVDGGSGAQGAEADGDLHYSPDTGLLTSTSFAGNPLQDVTTSSSTNTLTVAEAGLILVSDAHTETLPTASGNTGLTYHFIKTDADYDLITLEGDGSETFNYENSTGTPNLTYLRLNTYCAEVTIVSDGSNWQVINEVMGQVPDCYVILTANQLNLTDGKYHPIEFDSEIRDIGSNFDISTWVSGNATSTSAGHLVDSGGAFTSAMVDKRVKNTTDTTYTYITAHNSATDVTVRDDIFVDTEGYEIKNAKFVVPISGQYYANANIMWLWNTVVADKRYIVNIREDGTAAASHIIHSSNITNLVHGVVKYLSLDKDDVIYCDAFSGAGADTVDVEGINEYATSFQIKLISKD